MKFARPPARAGTDRDDMVGRGFAIQHRPFSCFLLRLLAVAMTGEGIRGSDDKYLTPTATSEMRPGDAAFL